MEATAQRKTLEINYRCKKAVASSRREFYPDAYPYAAVLCPREYFETLHRYALNNKISQGCAVMLRKMSQMVKLFQKVAMVSYCWSQAIRAPGHDGVKTAGQ